MKILLKKWISHRWLLSGFHALWEAGHRRPQPQRVAQGHARNFPVPGSVQDNRFRGKSKENEWIYRNRGRTPYFAQNLLEYVIPQCIHQSEGFPRTGYFFPACVERWAWPGHQSCWRAAAVAVCAVGVISPGAIFCRESTENGGVVKKIQESWLLHEEKGQICVHSWFLYGYSMIYTYFSLYGNSNEKMNIS